VGCFDGAKVRKDRVLVVEPAAMVAEPDLEAFDRRFQPPHPGEHCRPRELALARGPGSPAAMG
jgi:hypothetical protein